MNALALMLIGIVITPLLALAAWVFEALNARRKKQVLFIDHYNAGRSQLAQAYMRERYGRHFNVTSAGLSPAKNVYPMVYEVIRQLGLVHRLSRPQRLKETMLANKTAVLLCKEAEIRPVDPHITDLLSRNKSTFRWDDIDGLIGKTSLDDVRHIFTLIKGKIDGELVPLLVNRNGDPPARVGGPIERGTVRS